MTSRTLGIPCILLALALAAVACDSSTAPPATPDPMMMMCEPDTVVRPRARPIEYVGLTVDKPATLDEMVTFLDSLFGPAAVAGTRHIDYELQPGILLTVSEDPRTAGQLVVTLDMVPPGESTADRRTI